MTDREMNMNQERRCRGVLHVVRKGDTLYQLGRKYGVKVSAIMMSNPYVNVYNLQVGDELCIPKFEPVPIQRPESPAADESQKAVYDTIDYDYLESAREEEQPAEAVFAEEPQTVEAENVEPENVEPLSGEEPELSNTLKELQLTLQEFKEYMKQYQK